MGYTITFDPLTKTEQNHDYVRFIKVRDRRDVDLAYPGPLITRENMARCCRNYLVATCKYSVLGVAVMAGGLRYQ